MGCKKCKTVEDCGCEQKAMHISQICNPIQCDTEQCSESFDANCIIYTGEDIICDNVTLMTSGESVSQGFANLIAYLCGAYTLLDEDITCGVDIISTEGTPIKQALIEVAQYFCTAIEGLQVQIDTINGTISVMQGNITTNTTNIATNTSNISTIQGDITTIQGDITTIQGDIVTIQGNITNIQNDVTAIQSSLAWSFPAGASNITSLTRQLAVNTRTYYRLDAPEVHLELPDSATVGDEIEFIVNGPDPDLYIQCPVGNTNQFIDIISGAGVTSADGNANEKMFLAGVNHTDLRRFKML